MIAQDCTMPTLCAALERHHRALRGAMAEHEALFAAAPPDAHAIAQLRWRVAEAGRRRMDFLDAVAFPAIERHHPAAALILFHGLRDATPAYRRHVSDYVSRWSTGAIIGRWADYARGAPAFRAIVLERVAREAAILCPLLRPLRHTAADGLAA